MKLYVLPIGSLCNARCSYCITKFRKLKNAVLDQNKLMELLRADTYDRIEITGGGEPSLHPRIDQIVKACANSCPTNIYTNGSYNPQADSVHVCLSRAHHSDKINERIMGVKYDMSKYSGCKDLKLSLILHKDGISTLSEIFDYLDWAKDYAKKVVVRQLFEYKDENYSNYFREHYISTVELAEKMRELYPYEFRDGNYFFNINGLEVEFEGRACACEMSNPVLGADGKLREGWAEL